MQLSLSSQATGSKIIMKDPERDQLRKTILQFIKKGYVHYTDIEKKTVATCLSFATSNTFRKQFYQYLLPNGYIERVSRGIYKITPKGEKLLDILT
jgi:predicted transcriptional regulator